MHRREASTLNSNRAGSRRAERRNRQQTRPAPPYYSGAGPRPSPCTTRGRFSSRPPALWSWARSRDWRAFGSPRRSGRPRPRSRRCPTPWAPRSASSTRRRERAPAHPAPASLRRHHRLVFQRSPPPTPPPPYFLGTVARHRRGLRAQHLLLLLSPRRPRRALRLHLPARRAARAVRRAAPPNPVLRPLPRCDTVQILLCSTACVALPPLTRGGAGPRPRPPSTAPPRYRCPTRRRASTAAAAARPRRSRRRARRTAS